MEINSIKNLQLQSNPKITAKHNSVAIHSKPHQDSFERSISPAFGNHIEKLFKKAKNSAKITGDEAETLLTHYGFEEKGGKGSHHVFNKEDQTVTISPHSLKEELQKYQVKNVVKAIEAVIESEKK